MSNGQPGSPTGRPLLTVARRAANDTATLSAALAAGIDFVEADVRYFRGVPEVRDTKTVGRRLLWEPELVRRRDSTILTLADLMKPLGSEQHRLMVDLKGLRPGLAPAVAAVLAEHAPDAPVVITTPHWWMFKAFADAPSIRMLLSAGSWPMVERLRALLSKGQQAWPNQRPVYGCSVHRTLLTPAIVTELRQHVEQVITWPVDTPAQLTHATELGVTGVISQDLSLLETLVANR